jgi:hypothetical protein
MSVPFPRSGWAYPFLPEPKQLLMFRNQPDEMLYGGAAGGGKTDALLALGVTACLAVPRMKVLLIRKTYPEIEQEVLPRLLDRLPSTVAQYRQQGHTFTFRHNGAVFRLGHLSTQGARYRYQGVEYHLLLWDELTQFSRDEYMYLGTRLRAVGPVAEAMRQVNMRPRIVATSNPGGIGHGWVKKRFVDPGPPVTEFPGTDSEGEPDGTTVMYIPARVQDNRYVDREQYDRTLRRLDPALRAALRDGDWSVVEGARFGQFRYDAHVTRPLDVPLVGHPRAVGIDYGGTSPFAALWGVRLHDGLIYVYREVYRAGLTPKQQAALVRDSEMLGERMPGRPIPIALDPSAWARNADDPVAKAMGGAPPVGSIARAYHDVFGGSVVKARNARVQGWSLVDELLLVQDDGFPRLVIGEQCVNLIRTLPQLLRSNIQPEDVMTSPKQEDHAVDALRYLLGQLVLGGDRRVAPESRLSGFYRPATAGLTT